MRKSVLLWLSGFGLLLSLVTLIAQLTLLAADPLSMRDDPTARVSATGRTEFCINAVPVISVTCNSTMSQDSSYYCLLNATDMQDDEIIFTTNTTVFNITSNGTIAFTPTNDDVGNHTAIIFATDDSGCRLNQSNASFSFEVLNINDPPYLAKPLPNVKVVVNTTLSAFFLSDYFIDPDGDPLTYTSTSPSQITMTLMPSSEVRFTSNICDISDLVVFTATDPYNLSANSNPVEVEITCSDQSDGDGGEGGGEGGGGGSGFVNLCRPRWECQEWYACLPSGIQWQRCYDLAGCEGERHIKRECVYEGPPPVCQENWLCEEWANCLPNSTQYRACEDLSSCGTTAVMPPLEQKCVYYPTCNDGIQNGDETGIDCGGMCAACALVQKPSVLSGSVLATWLILVIILSILLVSGVAHYYRAQIAQIVATIGFMLRHRAYKDILLDVAQRKSYFERILSFEQLLGSPAGKEMKPESIYATLASLLRQYYTDALVVHIEALPEEVAARCKEMGLRAETTAILEGVFAKLPIIEQEELDYDEPFVVATLEELRMLVCLTSDYKTEELMRPVEELPVNETMSFYDEIFTRAVNCLRAAQFNQDEAARREYMTILSRYDALSEVEKEQIYPELHWTFEAVKFQSEITGARVVKKPAAT
jgi:hypothetical protein